MIDALEWPSLTAVVDFSSRSSYKQHAHSSYLIPSGSRTPTPAEMSSHLEGPKRAVIVMQTGGGKWAEKHGPRKDTS